MGHVTLTPPPRGVSILQCSLIKNPEEEEPQRSTWYGVATISRLLQIIGLFCKRDLQKRLYSAKETYNLKDPTTRSHPIQFFVVSGASRNLYKLYIYVYVYVSYRVATSSRLLKIIGLFCKRAL